MADEIDDEVAMARSVLRSLADEPAPPVHTDLAVVLAKGKRRLLVQRAAAAVGVVLVVGGVALGTSVLVHRGPADRVSTANGSGQLPGWELVTSTSAAPDCQQAFTPPSSAPPSSTQQPAARAVQAFDSAIEAAVRTAVQRSGEPDGDLVTRQPDAPVGSVRFEVSGTTGIGLLTLVAGPGRGAPQQAADADLAAHGACGAPQRRTLANGAVLLLYPAGTSGGLPVQYLVVFTASGYAYQVFSQPLTALPAEPTTMVPTPATTTRAPARAATTAPTTAPTGRPAIGAPPVATSAQTQAQHGGAPVTADPQVQAQAAARAAQARAAGALPLDQTQLAALGEALGEQLG
ncbi:MAG TPA: hypothetical protein VHW44_02815 [Pseudonocardiaceae bacterium]|jgi:hypothetical protein|nr:hypothetical protein [Pseudonocardiaceae bacterium]